MSESMNEPQGAAENAAPSGNWQQMARYTIHVPVRDNKGREIPHILHAVRQALTNSGLPGRTVIRKAQGDWQGDQTHYETEEMDLVMIDAPDDPQVDQAVSQAAQMIIDATDQEAIYITKTPVATQLVTRS